MARKTTIAKWAVLTLLVVYACWATVWAHREAARHVCTGVEVIVDNEGREDIARKSEMDSIIRSGVRQELEGYPARIVGTRLAELDTHAIEKYLSRLSNFESVNCMVTSGGLLRVKVVPLVPVMRVFFRGNSYYINKDGKHIDSNAEFFSDVPVVNGVFRRGFQPRDVLPLVRFVNSDPMLSEVVSMIEARDPHNLLLIPRIQGHVVNFGDTTRLAEKKEALKLFYTKVMPYKGWECYDTISVKFRGQIVATRRNKALLNHAEIDWEEEDLEEGTLPAEDEQPGATPGTGKVKTEVKKQKTNEDHE